MVRRWVVAQIGAREHYAVGRALVRHGRLRALFTDLYCSRLQGLLRRGPASVRAFAARHHPELQPDRVLSFPVMALAERLRRRLQGGGRTAEYEAYVREGRAFARRVARALRAEGVDAALDGCFAYDTGALELFEWLRDEGVPTVVDQIDPGPFEEELVVAERARWPGWEPDAGRIPPVYWDRLRAEWSVATRVMVNSEWSRRALVGAGVPEAKIVVVPLAYEAELAAAPRSPVVRRGPLQVLWVGSVILRKGIQYLIEAARRLQDRSITFIVAGPIGISRAAVASAPANVRFLGRVTRDRVGALYRSADVFVLPTISDGFALTQLEALAHGVPVVVTPNCARVVTDGEDGLVVPAADAAALASALARLDDDREALAAMAAQAPLTAARYSLDRVAEDLLAGLDVEATA